MHINVEICLHKIDIPQVFTMRTPYAMDIVPADYDRSLEKVRLHYIVLEASVKHAYFQIHAHITYHHQLSFFSCFLLSLTILAYKLKERYHMKCSNERLLFFCKKK